jgi:hypothetical protein
MHDKSTAPIISPDGNFAVIIEEDRDDRGFILYNTYLVESATGERIFACEGSPRAEFAGDGLLTIHYPGYEPFGVQIDPVKRAFRTHPSDLWIPATAWGVVESAYKRGWAQRTTYQHQTQPTPFPWVAIILLLGSVVALPVLCVQTFLSDAKSAELMIVAAVGVLFFGWLTASSFRYWKRERK